MKNALIAEFIGAFFLYLIIGICVTQPANAGVDVPLVIGLGFTTGMLFIKNEGHQRRRT